MPDPFEMALAAFAAAVTAYLTVIIVVRVAPRACRAVAGSAESAALLGGTLAGAAVLQLWPELPPAQARHRLLVVVLPLLFVVQAVSALPRVPAWLGGVLRAAFCFAIPVVLLWQSSWLTGDAWSPGAARVGLVALGLMLAAAWAGTAATWHLAPNMMNAAALALATAGAAVAIMLSGSVTTGQLGPAVTGAVIGGAASLGRRRTALSGRSEGGSGLGVVALFGLLLIGHFFAELGAIPALLFLAAPITPCLAMLPGLRMLPRRLRPVARLLLAAVPVAVALALVAAPHGRADDASGGGSGTSIIDDYANF